ncbi:MAG: alpha/beta fold hydrolase [Alphaproteobacteria bacterium]|nr:alpha/beta fold hydrolase [Alphaproteobacteria bacterium]
MAASNMTDFGSFSPDIQQYVAHYAAPAAENDILAMMKGVRLYYDHPYQPDHTRRAPLWQDGTTCIYSASKPCKNPERVILLVPSLVNGPEILDLIEDRSLLEWMNNNNIEAYLLDWGELTKAHDDISVDHLVTITLPKALQFIANKTGRAVDILGYCMGGTLCVAASLYAKQFISKMILLAAPWDFHTGNPLLSDRVRTWAPVVLPVIDQKKLLPARWTQSLFASLDPKEALGKFKRFSQMDQSSTEAKIFVAVEDWINNGRDLPAPVAQHCIRHWFSANAPAKGTWVVNDSKINVSNIETPILIIASKNDKLVPYASAIEIKKSLPDNNAHILQVSCGHIGMIAGAKAVHDVWLPIRDWLLKK